MKALIAVFHRPTTRVLLRAGHQANWFVVKMILLAWFTHLEEKFFYKVVQFKMCYLPLKTSCPSAKNANEIPETSVPPRVL